MFKEIVFRNKLKLFLSSFLILFSLTILLSFVGNFIGGDEVFVKNSLEDKNLIIIFLTIVIIVPIFETFVFQFVIIELLYLIKYKNIKYLTIIIAGLLFGATHWYNFIYFISATIIGIFFSYYYIKFREYGLKFSFFGICGIHITINFISFLINNVLNIDI